jgi:hypothetical protein
MSTNFLNFNKVSNSVSSYNYQKKYVENLLQNLISANSFSEFRTSYFSGFCKKNNRYWTEGGLKKNKIVDQITRNLFLDFTNGTKHQFTSDWARRLSDMVNEPDIKPYQRVGNILGLFKEWRNFLATEGIDNRLTKSYLLCQKELRSLLNFFQLKEIKKCPGPLSEKPLSMAGVFHDYRQSYGDDMLADTEFKMHDQQSMLDVGSISMQALRTHQSNRHRWCSSHTWVEVFAFDNRVFDEFRYCYKTDEIYVTYDINSELLAFHHLMLETHPDQFDREKTVGFLKNIIERIDQRFAPVKATKSDLERCGKPYGTVGKTKTIADIIAFCATYDFQPFFDMETEHRKINDPRETIKKLPLSDEEKKKIGWDAWGMLVESSVGDTMILENYVGADRSDIRKAVFSYDYSKLKGFNPASDILKKDLLLFINDVPHLQSVLDMASSMGFKGREMHRLVANTMENMKTNTACDLVADMKPMNCEVQDCITQLF